MNFLSPLKKLLKINYQEQLERETIDSLYDARKRYLEMVQQQLYTDAMVHYQYNRIKFLSQVVDKLKGSQDDKSNCVTSVVVYADYNLQHGQRNGLPRA